MNRRLNLLSRKPNLYLARPHQQRDCASANHRPLIYELDERKRKPRSVDDDFIDEVKSKVRDAAEALRTATLPTAPAPKKCGTCDYRGMCTAGRAAAATK